MIELIDANGKKLASGYIVPDGGKLRVPHLMMDAAPAGIEAITKTALADSKPDTARHAPGGLALTDADREAREKALDARDKRVTDAWRNPPAQEAQAKPGPVADGEAAALRRDARLESAWKAGAA
jgi:hypothetical protein